MSRLVEFYRGQARDTEGRRLDEIWDWDDGSLEAAHDFIQWLFPLPEPSRFNPDAPILSADDLRTFRGDPLLQTRLQRSFERVLRFLGLTLTPDGKVVPGDNFAARVPDVWAYPNHNWLRITRILRSLTLLGREAQARALYERLSEMYSSRKYGILGDTFGYWTGAVQSRLPCA
jgi:hypothetical protein